jgi:DNA repair protein RecN (Recombination protein N)
MTDLCELRVRDLGVISDLTLRFDPGMTVLTGETGAGKTLLVQALQLVLGGRAAAGLVRSGASEALVEARFVLDGPAGKPTEHETVLARAVPASGRSRAWIDGRMVPVSALAGAGADLVDIHGQHEQQSLLSAAAQRAVLDQFGGSDLRPLADARRAVAAIARQLGGLGGDDAERARRADLLRHQVTEIERAGIEDPDEDGTLAAEEARLADIASLREAAARALAALDDGDATTGGGATTLLGHAIATLSGRNALSTWERRLRDAVAEVADVVADLRQVVETWEDDPGRLQDVQARRRQLADLRHKYGATLADVVAFGDAARGSLAELERQDEVATALGRRMAEAEATVASEESALRDARLAAAPGLAAAVTERLRVLAMPDARLAVAVGDEGAGDAVELLLGANRGEPVQPLARVASGGELARTMLALCLVVDRGAPTMLFDEVDAGVGGAAALALAGALRAVAASRQVLVVTHLPQVAAFADHHVAVRKTVGADGRTVASAEVLGTEDRIVELSRMLSGHPDSPTARAHAEELLLAGRGAGASTTTGRAGD